VGSNVPPFVKFLLNHLKGHTFYMGYMVVNPIGIHMQSNSYQGGTYSLKGNLNSHSRNS